MDSPILLVDSYAQIYRGYHAVRYLSTPDGVPTNAVFAMTKLLMKLKEEYEGYEGAFVFDKGRPAQRMALAPAYKANRPPMPDDLRSQLETIREMIRAFGWNIIEWDGSEADDLIAAAAENFKDRKVLIVSSDKDISQIIDDRIEMLVPDHDGKGFTRRGVQETIAKFGVKPAAVVDYLSLIGDSSDNIPGVEGVGPKTAAALLNQFESIEDMLARTDEIKRESLREKIRASAEVMRLNQKLILPPSSTFMKVDDISIYSLGKIKGGNVVEKRSEGNLERFFITEDGKVEGAIGVGKSVDMMKSLSFLGKPFSPEG